MTQLHKLDASVDSKAFVNCSGSFLEARARVQSQHLNLTEPCVLTESIMSRIYVHPKTKKEPIYNTNFYFQLNLTLLFHLFPFCLSKDSKPMKLHNPNFTALFSTYLHMNMILLITITPLCFQPATSSATSTNENDRLALLQFKGSFVNDPHGILISWNDSIQFCNWHRITCGCRHQRVTSLELQGHDLRGTISAYIGNLTFLRTINLLNNSFYGEIPNEVCHLFRLQHLNLFTNMLGGEIPASLTNCSELRMMDLSWNELVGTIPMGLRSLTNLFSLQVA